jgi:hypothetical protein
VIGDFSNIERGKIRHHFLEGSAFGVIQDIPVSDALKKQNDVSSQDKNHVIGQIRAAADVLS